MHRRAPARTLTVASLLLVAVVMPIGAPSSPFYSRKLRFHALSTYAPPTTTIQSYPRSFRVHPPVPKGTHINRSLGSVRRPVILDATRPLPCCKDVSGGAMCRSLKTHDLRNFANSFFTEMTNTTNCFDRMSPTFCGKFAKNADTWSPRRSPKLRWSCDTEHYRLGFRVCRQTCGFCNLDWKNARETAKCIH